MTREGRLRQDAYFKKTARANRCGLVTKYMGFCPGVPSRGTKQTSGCDD
jgi:hypothetical protein